MKYIIVILIIFIQNSYSKEKAIYNVTGGELIDLIRGIPPKEGVLKLEKVDGTDEGNLPDGIYYVPPADDVLTSKGTPFLYVNKHAKTEDSHNIPVFVAEKDDQNETTLN